MAWQHCMMGGPIDRSCTETTIISSLIDDTLPMVFLFFPPSRSYYFISVISLPRFSPPSSRQPTIPTAGVSFFPFLTIRAIICPLPVLTAHHSLPTRMATESSSETDPSSSETNPWGKRSLGLSRPKPNIAVMLSTVPSLWAKEIDTSHIAFPSSRSRPPFNQQAGEADGLNRETTNVPITDV